LKKIITLDQLSKVTSNAKKKGRTIGLITGCFDVLHIGHVQLFEFAKSRVDLLVVGIDNDKTIKLSKGDDRPLFNQDERASVLSALSAIDYVFIVDDVYKYGSPNLDHIFDNILLKVKPDYLITTKQTDRFWENKKKKMEKFGGKLISHKLYEEKSSTNIIKKLGLS